jgi:hypothetical protein
VGKEDNEMLDRALDAAEARLSEETPVPDETEVEDNPEVPDETEENSSPSEKEVVEAEEVKQFTKKEAAPEKQGKPTKGQKQAKQKDLSGQDANVEVVEAEPPPIDLPTFWPAELKAAAAKAPRDVVDLFAKHDAQRAQWANRIAAESERGRAIEKRANEIFEPRKAELLANKIKDPFDAVEYLLGWDEVFKKDPMLGISDLMRKNGLTPYDFIEDGRGAYPQGGAQYEDPRVEEALREAKEAKESLQKWQEDQQTKSMASEIESFKDEKDSSGQVRRPFAEAYAPQISQAVEAIQRLNPQMSLKEALSHGYDYVLDESRKMFGVNGKVNGAPAKDPNQAIAAAKKAKAAASSIKGSPSSEATSPRPRLKGKNFNEMIDSALDNAFSALDNQ